MSSESREHESLNYVYCVCVGVAENYEYLEIRSLLSVADLASYLERMIGFDLFYPSRFLYDLVLASVLLQQLAPIYVYYIKY